MAHAPCSRDSAAHPCLSLSLSLVHSPIIEKIPQAKNSVYEMLTEFSLHPEYVQARLLVQSSFRAAGQGFIKGFPRAAHTKGMGRLIDQEADQPQPQRSRVEPKSLSMEQWRKAAQDDMAAVSLIMVCTSLSSHKKRAEAVAKDLIAIGSVSCVSLPAALFAGDACFARALMSERPGCDVLLSGGQSSPIIAQAFVVP